MQELREAYDAASWDQGPRRVYDALASSLVDRAELDLTDALALDAGAGDGAVTRALQARGAEVVACDLSAGMLASLTDPRPPALVADVRRLPLRGECFDLAAAGFVLSHMPAPGAALAELVRVCRRGGTILASSFTGSTHPAREAVDGAARSLGYARQEWYRHLKEDWEPAVATASRLSSVAGGAGLVDVDVRETVVDLGRLSPEELASWRLAMPALAHFAARLDPQDRRLLHDRALAAVSVPMPPVRLGVLLLRGRRPRT